MIPNAKQFGIRNLFAIISFLFVSATLHAQVAINNDNSSPDASAMLDIKATGLGFLAPRMTFAQRPVSPATGLIIYQTDSDPGFYYFDGSEWQKTGRAADNPWLKNGSDIYFTAGKVAVGVDNPDLHGLYVQNYVTGKSAVRGTDQVGTTIYADGMLGVLFPGSVGIPGNFSNVGVLGIKPAAGLNGAAVLGWNNDVNSLNYAGYFVSDGTGFITNYGIYSKAENGNSNLAGFFNGRVIVEGNSTGTDAIGNVLIAEVKHNQAIDTRAVYAKSVPSDGYGFGVYGEGGWRGVYGRGAGGTYTGTTYGVFGEATGTAGTRIGVYGAASGGTTNWAGYFTGSTYVSTNLRIGTTTQATGYALSVNGKIIATEVRVEAFSNWPDYVFDPGYKLMGLDELEESINKNQHLPGIPSAKQVAESGFDLGDMQRRLLEKVEELTLHTIRQEKMIRELQQEISTLRTAE